MEFNLNRVFGLLKKDIRDILIPTTKVLSLVFLGLTIITILNQIGENTDNLQYFYNWSGFFVISSGIFGVLSFYEISKRHTRIEYLSLPASIIEKTSAKAILVLIAFPLLMVLFYVIYFYFFKIVCQLSGLATAESLNFSDPMMRMFIYLSVVISSFFAFGSIKFNTGSFIKIILWLSAIGAIWVTFMFLTGVILFPEFRAGIMREVFGVVHETNYIIQTNNDVQPGDHWVIRFTVFFYKFLILPLFWTLIYFTIKEKEA